MINKETANLGPIEKRNFKERLIQTFNIFLGKDKLLYNAIILMFTQVTILEGITPFVLPFISVVPLGQIPNMIIVTLLFGLISQNSNILLLVLSMFFIWLIKRRTSDNPVYSLALLPLIITFSYGPILVTSDFISFDLFLLALQIIMGLTSAYVFKQGLSLFT